MVIDETPQLVDAIYDFVEQEEIIDSNPELMPWSVATLLFTGFWKETTKVADMGSLLISPH